VLLCGLPVHLSQQLDGWRHTSLALGADYIFLFYLNCRNLNCRNSVIFKCSFCIGWILKSGISILQRNVFFVLVDWYESTGELLGEGAFGHVATYRHNRTNKEFAVKVTVKTTSVILYFVSCCLMY